jgi:pilus assembly protein CpaB
LFSWRRKKEGSSPSAAWKGKVREFLPLGAGVVLTVLAVLAAKQRIAALETEIRDRDRPLEIVVAAAPIPAGGYLTEESLAKRAVPASGASPRNVRAAEFERIAGAKAKEDIAPGEPVLWSDIEDPAVSGDFSRTIPAGRRAITIEADAGSSFSGLLRPGDRVDILHEPPEGKGFRPLLLDIPVIAVDRLFRRPPTGEGFPDISTLTLSVAPAESERLSSALRHGGIRVILRHPDDRSRPAPRGAQRGPRARAVEIWKAGILETAPPRHGEDGT